MDFDKMNKAIIMIDDDLIEAADAQPEIAKATAFKPWMKYAVAAVLIAVFTIGTPVALNMAGVFGTNNTVDPASSGSGSGGDVSEVIYPPEDDSHSTVSEPPQPIVPASTGDVGSYEEPDPNLPHGGDDRKRLTDNKYMDKLTSFGTALANYIFERTGKDMDTLWKTVWGGVEQGHVAPFSMLEVVQELNIPKEKFIELNNKDHGRRSMNDYPNISEYRNWVLTDEDIDIMYSGDKKRIAEAFAQPYAVIADDWEIYPLRWIINTPASVYKEKHISLSVLETTVYKLTDKGESFISDEDRYALFARIDEYREMQ